MDLKDSGLREQTNEGTTISGEGKYHKQIV